MTSFGDFYAGKRVLVTGHTGFKGAWLTLWLREMGADVVGYSLAPPSSPSLFEACGLERLIKDVRGDILDYDNLLVTVRQHRPEIVFHLAAQALVRTAYAEPRQTFNVNVIGTANVLEAARETDSVSLVVAVTSDKVYRNVEDDRAFRENDPLGGYEPYGVSKACAEMIVGAYQDQRFQSAAGSARELSIASVRAGNVIGGGDWASYRIIPDIMRAMASGDEIVIRHPQATRPWQHALDALSGYLCLATRLAREPSRFASAWNFGPADLPPLTVQQLVHRFLELWPRHNAVRYESAAAGEHLKLRVDSTKARQELGWRPAWDIDQTLAATVDWYRTHQSAPDMALDYTRAQIADYCAAARRAGIAWAS
jgi:CDP-glucose 4,6-dehydratase